MGKFSAIFTFSSANSSSEQHAIPTITTTTTAATSNNNNNNNNNTNTNTNTNNNNNNSNTSFLDHSTTRPSTINVNHTSSPSTKPNYFSTTPTTSPVIETQEIKKSIDSVSGLKTINNYLIIKELGRGVHGKVKLAKNMDTQQLVAIKILRKEQSRGRRLFSSYQSNKPSQIISPLEVPSPSSNASDLTPNFLRPGYGSSIFLHNPQLEKIHREIAILKKCRHPNIVQLFEILDHPSSRKVYIVLEYLAGGELVWQVENRPCLDMETVRLIFRDVVVGLEYLHSQGIIHRDIKPANLLRTETGHVKLSDFGVSYFSQQQFELEQKKMSQRRESFQSKLLKSLPIKSHVPSTTTMSSMTINFDEELAKTVGSPAFFAPELCSLHDDVDSDTSNYIITKAIDIWALGVTLYCLCFGICPFTADSEYKLFETISTQPVTFPPDIFVTPNLEDLIRRILTKEPDQRPTLDLIKRHPWTLQGLSDPEKWLSETDPILYDPVHVTEEEVKQAFTQAVDKLKHQLRRLSSSFQSLSLFSANKSKAKSLPSVSPLAPRPFSLPSESMIVPSPSHSLSPTSSSPSSPSSTTYPTMIFPLSPLNEPNDMEIDPIEAVDDVDPEWAERQRRSTWESALPLTYEDDEDLSMSSLVNSSCEQIQIDSEDVDKKV